MWDLGLVLFDSHKDVVSTKSINFGYVPFPLKRLILKDFSESVFVL